MWRKMKFVLTCENAVVKIGEKNAKEKSNDDTYQQCLRSVGNLNRFIADLYFTTLSQKAAIVNKFELWHLKN